jgi:hypothetical protein
MIGNVKKKSKSMKSLDLVELYLIRIFVIPDQHRFLWSLEHYVDFINYFFFYVEGGGGGAKYGWCVNTLPWSVQFYGRPLNLSVVLGT